MSFKSSLLTGATVLCALTSANPVQNSQQATYLQYASAAYSLVDSYTSSNFFSSFNFFTDPDPTHGFVSYQGQGDAQNAGLYNTNNGQIYMGVDSTTYNPVAPGRKSVRLTSNKAYTHGLFIADIAHMPGSACGVWVSFPYHSRSSLLLSLLPRLAARWKTPLLRFVGSENTDYRYTASLLAIWAQLAWFRRDRHYRRCESARDESNYASYF